MELFVCSICFSLYVIDSLYSGKNTVSGTDVIKKNTRKRAFLVECSYVRIQTLTLQLIRKLQNKCFRFIFFFQFEYGTVRR